MQAMESTKPCGEKSLNLAIAMLGLRDLGVDLTSPISPVNGINNNPTSNRSNVSNFPFNLPLTLTPSPSPTQAHVTSVIGDGRTKKYQSITTTECVPVPSCDHVAEIVGRQGTKIKALRIKTNTHIKTPARGEEPVFIVTGRKDDVYRAKREILYAALHFTQIRAARKTNNINGTSVTSPTTPGHITIPVHVPYDVVGLVVGPKGATVKKIQQQSNTYIVTPSRDKEPVFYVTGTSSNVQLARQEIEAHIAVRTGRTLEIKNSSDEIENVSDFSTIDKNTLDSILNCNNAHSLELDDGIYKKKSLSSGCSSISSQLSLGCLMTKSSDKEDIGSVWGISKNVAANFERDEGIGESPSCETATLPSLNTWSFPSLCNFVDNSPWSQKNTICVVCEKGAITTALVPCGHNMFCQECGDNLSSKPDSCCPVCGTTSYQAIRIITP